MLDSLENDEPEIRLVKSCFVAHTTLVVRSRQDCYIHESLRCKYTLTV